MKTVANIKGGLSVKIKILHIHLGIVLLTMRNVVRNLTSTLKFT